MSAQRYQSSVRLPGTGPLPHALEIDVATSAAYGSPELDYPYVMTASSTQRLDAASLFGKTLTESYGLSHPLVLH